MLGRYISSPPAMWLITFAYDMLAFTPQSLIGYLSDRFSMFAAALALAAVAVLLIIKKRRNG